MLCDDQTCSPTQDQYKGILQKSESSLICLIIAEGSANVLPIFMRILAHFCIPISLHNKNVLRQCLTFCGWSEIFPSFVVIMVWRWGVRLYYCDVERDCPQADVNEPAGDWATSHDSVHDVLVNKKSNAMLMFILFSTEENCVLPLLLFRQSSSISFHIVQGCSICTCPFHVLVPEVSQQLLVSVCSKCRWWCYLFLESSMILQ